MTYEVNEVNEILRIEYGKDCGGIIMKFIYPKCEQCKELYHKDKIFDTFDDKYVCVYCYTKLRYRKCHSCVKMYEFCKTKYCKSCLGNCKVYCAYCLDDEYRKGFTSLKVLDSILQRANDIINS